MMELACAGVEGTGSYGAELARVLTREGVRVLEVMRPNRQGRRLRGKSDPLDAYQAAEAALAGRNVATPKSWNGAVESLRVLRAERATAMGPGSGHDPDQKHPYRPGSRARSRAWVNSPLTR